MLGLLRLAAACGRPLAPGGLVPPSTWTDRGWNPGRRGRARQGAIWIAYSGRARWWDARWGGDRGRATKPCVIEEAPGAPVP